MKELGISRWTVSNALNELVASGLLERRRGLGTFVSEHLAAGEGGRPYAGKVIHVFFPDREGVWGGRGWCGQILHSIESTTRPLGITLAYHAVGTTGQKSLSDALAGLYLDQNAIGVCLAGAALDEKGVFKLMETGLPFVAIAWYMEDIRVNCVMLDDRGGAAQAAEHLAGLGHARIGLVSYPVPNSPSHGDRIDAFRETAVRHGIELPAEGVLYMAERDALSPELLDGFLKACRPTALFCADDKVAGLVLRAAHRLAIAIPAQLSVVGFGDDTMGLAGPLGLTTVGVDSNLIGEKTAELLLNEHALSHPKHVVVPTFLVERETTAPPQA